MPKISVIVPVYNTAKYVEKCLDSICNQKLNDLELIIVNDGSEDNSEAIIKKWMKNNENKIKIKYLKKENGGLSESRNFAILYVTGKYISFIDSDDYISEDLYSNLEKYMDENIDLIKFKMQKVDGKENILEKLDGPVFEECNGEEGYEKLCTNDKFLDPACIYLYRTEFYKQNNFEYAKGTYACSHFNGNVSMTVWKEKYELRDEFILRISKIVRKKLYTIGSSIIEEIKKIDVENSDAFYDKKNFRRYLMC